MLWLEKDEPERGNENYYNYKKEILSALDGKWMMNQKYLNLSDINRDKTLTKQISPFAAITYSTLMSFACFA